MMKCYRPVRRAGVGGGGGRWVRWHPLLEVKIFVFFTDEPHPLLEARIFFLSTSAWDLLPPPLLAPPFQKASGGPVLFRSKALFNNVFTLEKNNNLSCMSLHAISVIDNV